MNKAAIYALFEDLILQRIRGFQENLAELKEAGRNETKSTAGDKHETALAMLQLEQEKKRKQLREAEEQLAGFRKIDPAKTSGIVARGSLVTTDKGIFFVSLALGKRVYNDLVILSVSPVSPLGGKLMGRKTGDQIQVNNQTYNLLAVF